ncbi:hypothetical protein AB0M46_32895 [Dactylosporangium sp. NPDC051485]|uniref:hypothetical protein n=1 Tax=Dactylosporangium sp. NPDC051485 TaxID=3154846 RepID=UPI0034181B1F
MDEAALLVAVGIEPEHGQIALKAGRLGASEDGYWPPQWDGGEWAVSGTGCILVATRPDSEGTVDVAVFRGRPHFDGDWTRVHTARIVVEEDGGLAVAMTVSDEQTPVPVGEGPYGVEVWVRPPTSPEAVTFVLLG